MDPLAALASALCGDLARELHTAAAVMQLDEVVWVGGAHDAFDERWEALRAMILIGAHSADELQRTLSAISG